MSGFEDIVPAQYLTEFLSKISSSSENRKCFDCGEPHAPWASVNNGVFICINCSGRHRSFGVNLSFVKSVSLDTSWSWKHLRTMQVGGNANAKIVAKKAEILTKPLQEKYSHEAMVKYRRQLKANAFKHHQLFKCELGTVNVVTESSREPEEFPMKTDVILNESAPVQNETAGLHLTPSSKSTKKKSKLGALRLDLNQLENSENSSALRKDEGVSEQPGTSPVTDRLGFASKSYNLKPRTHAAEEITVKYSEFEEKGNSKAFRIYCKDQFITESFERSRSLKDDEVNYVSVEPDPITRSNISHELKKKPVTDFCASSNICNSYSDFKTRNNEVTTQMTDREVFEKFKNSSAISSDDFCKRSTPVRNQTNKGTGLEEFVQTFSDKFSQLKKFTSDKLSELYDEYIDY